MEEKYLFLKEITEAKAISGFEGAVRRIMEREMKKLDVEISNNWRLVESSNVSPTIRCYCFKW